MNTIPATGAASMTVTCTGVDADTPLHELLALARDHPQAEWGVLVRVGDAEPHADRGAFLGRKARRYPPADALRHIADFLQTHGLRAALHLCGHRVDDFIATAEHATWPGALATVLPAFGRVQLNARLGAAHAAQMPALAARLQRNPGQAGPTRLVVQWNRHNHGFWAALLALDAAHAVDCLVDASGGRGLLPQQWPSRSELPGLHRGYAGGLTAQNLAAQWPALQAAAGGQPDWIDAEAALRDADDGFCLRRCRAWLEATAVL